MKIESADTDAWNNAEGKRGQKPTMIRYRPNLATVAGDTNYPRRLVIRWDYEETDSSGLPSDEQSDSLRKFEDALINTLDHDRLAILAFVFTHSGTREWQFYTSDIREVGGRINSALADFPKLPIKLSVEDDPDWDEFSLLLKQCNGK